MARRPLSELAPPTSTANSVRLMAALEGVVSDGSGSVDAELAVCGGAAEPVDSFSGSVNFAAAASGGAISDCVATNGGGDVDVLAAVWDADETVVGPWSASMAAVSTGGFATALVGMVASADSSGGAA
jgi:hypothetical protein